MKSASFGQVVKCGLFSYLQAYATEETVRTLYAKLHDELLVATMLALTSEDVTTALDQWSDRPQATSYKTPARKGGWTRKELLILGQRWFCGDAINEISHMIGRTPGSISAKRRRLGLPPRIRLSKAQAEAIQEEKRAAIPEDPTIILTWEQASLLTSHARRGRTWCVRNSLAGIQLTAHVAADKVRWHEAANIEIAYRHFAFQSPSEIARDFLISESALKSQSSWEQLPPRQGMKTPWFHAAKAEQYIKEHGYVRRECLSKSGCYFWTTQRGGERVSRRYRRSVSAIHGIAA